MPITTNNEQLILRINAFDSLYNIMSINIWINNIPVYGIDGYKIEEMTKNINKDLEIDLSQGINYIDVSVTNSKGIESFKKSFSVFCQKQTQPTLYIL
jgi:translation initiation factor 2 alpha subunit (eIF-2alpha)